VACASRPAPVWPRVSVQFSGLSGAIQMKPPSWPSSLNECKGRASTMGPSVHNSICLPLLDGKHAMAPTVTITKIRILFALAAPKFVSSRILREMPEQTCSIPSCLALSASHTILGANEPSRQRVPPSQTLFGAVRVRHGQRRRRERRASGKARADHPASSTTS